jgi:hypothetical protein
MHLPGHLAIAAEFGDSIKGTPICDIKAVGVGALFIYRCTPVSTVTRPKTYRGCVKPRVIPTAIHNVMFV